MTIGELAAESGMPASTIRYWKRIGVLPKPTRVSGQSCGFHLDEMRHLLHGFGAAVQPPRRWQELARQKRQELDEQIARLKTMRRVVDRVMQCQCLELTECGRIAASVMENAR